MYILVISYVYVICGIIYTRFHAFHVHINVKLFSHVYLHLYDGEKQVC